MLQPMEKFRDKEPDKKIFGLHTFADQGWPISPTGPFRENILVFLDQCSKPERYEMEDKPVWSTYLANENRGFLVPLFTVVESKNQFPLPECPHCRSTGWTHDFSSERRYHLRIPADEDWDKPLDYDVFTSQFNLLSGVIHDNGYGHLIYLNGIQGGSKYLTGKETMDLWDRICTNLHVRQISLEDVSKKWGMDLRLLYGVAYKGSWFGQWGYDLGTNANQVTPLNYQNATEFFESLHLDTIIDTLPNNSLFEKVVGHYRLSSEGELLRLGELLRFMITSKPMVHSVMEARLKGVREEVIQPRITASGVVLGARRFVKKWSPDDDGKSCICEGSNQYEEEMMKCSKCQKVHHVNCVGISADAQQWFKCDGCFRFVDMGDGETVYNWEY